MGDEFQATCRRATLTQHVLRLRRKSRHLHGGGVLIWELNGLVTLASVATLHNYTMIEVCLSEAPQQDTFKLSLETMSMQSFLCKNKQKKGL